MREINMQYPLDSTGSNRYFDGNIHRISPRQLSSFIINNTKSIESNGISFFI